ncbi:MAG: hypothetical protein AB8C40_00905 [Gammaproteobacteria bacterium]
MKEFDLIPEDYRLRVVKLRIIKILLIVFVLLMVSTGIAYGAIELVKNNTSTKLDELKRINEVTRQQQDELRNLQSIKNNLNDQWELLNSLRSTPPPEELLMAIDRGLDDLDLWFTNLRFDRTEQITPRQDDINTGYFIIINSDSNKDSLSIGTKMVITGGSSNHATLSFFVKNLLSDSTILDAKVLETTTDRRSGHSHINFVLEIVVNPYGTA